MLLKTFADLEKLQGEEKFKFAKSKKVKLQVFLLTDEFTMLMA